MSMNWYARINAQEYGPVTVEQLQQWAMESLVLPTTEVRQGETGTWVQASQVQGLLPSAVAPAMPQAQSLNNPTNPQVTTTGPSVTTTSAGSRYRKTKRRGGNSKTSDANARWIGGAAIAGVCFVFLGGLVFWMNNISSQTSSSNTNTGKKPSVEYTATELMDHYEENSIRADQACKGQIFGVTGTIRDISTDILDTPYVTFESGELISSVQCMFDDSYKAKLAKLNPGDTVRIRGTCEGQLLLNVIFRDCSFY